MRLGFAVKLVSSSGFKASDARRHASGPHLRTSIELLTPLLGELDRLDLRMYRIPDGFVPYGTHPDLPQFHGQIEECAAELAELGELVRRLDIRMSNHPGQYTVLNSTREDVRDKAAWDLDQHAALFDAMGLGDEAVVVLHVGGTTDGHDAGIERFERALDNVSERARRRLVIENDDRSYSLPQVVELSRRTGLRVVFDTLHHFCLDPERMPAGEALAAALATWPTDQVPKVHVSSPRLDATWPAPVGTPPTGHDTRAHADFIDPMWFERWLETDVRASGRPFDVMVEAKAKDVAVLRLRDQLAARGYGWRDGQLQLR
ncbi:MAG: uvdE [Thermoleophilia bacterium]|nr:uvdE [Thermoleophilia bacterium]